MKWSSCFGFRTVVPSLSWQVQPPTCQIFALKWNVFSNRRTVLFVAEVFAKAPLKIVSAQEMMLTANQNRSTFEVPRNASSFLRAPFSPWAAKNDHLPRQAWDSWQQQEAFSAGQEAHVANIEGDQLLEHRCGGGADGAGCARGWGGGRSAADGDYPRDGGEDLPRHLRMNGVALLSTRDAILL
jgi:hypothetical protein